MSDLASDAATAIVPQAARMSRLGLTMAWWGCCSAMFYVFLGARLAISYGTVNAQSFFEGILPVRWPKAVWVLFIGVIVLILMRSTSVFSYMLTALEYQGIVLTAWVGCALRFVRTSALPNEEAAERALAAAPEYRLRPLIAWFTAALLGVSVAQSDLLSSFSPVVAFATAFIAYAGWGGQDQGVSVGSEAL